MARSKRAIGLSPATERAHVRAVTRIWELAQGIIAYGLAPLLEIWPRAAKTDEYDPLRPAPMQRHIWDLTDAELRQLWPDLDPREVRRWAPWATSRGQVLRIAYPAGQPPTGDLGDYVARAILAARARDPVPWEEYEPSELERAPYAFRLRPRSYAPVVMGSDGFPIPPPPTITAITEEAIRRQISWVDLSLGRLLEVESIERSITRSGEKVAIATRHQLERVIGIDLRKSDPMVARYINVWRNHNVALIESGIMGHEASPRLRPSLLEDVTRTVEAAHREGLRVEILAHDLAERFGVSDSRAELIARDQILKLNGQITKQRQMAVGITHYRWSTSKDERVRDRHRDLDGEIFEWTSPPEVAPGRYEHPGGDYQCRCVAIPVMPGD